MAIDIRILCAVRVIRDDVPICLASQARTVLAMLALGHGTPVSTDRLIDALWGGRPPQHARVRVQSLVSEIRRALGCRGPGSPVRTEPAGYVLRLAPAELDLHRYAAGLALAQRLRRLGQVEAAVQRYDEALALWSGTPCSDVDRPAVRDQAEALLRTHADALEDWAELALALGQSALVARCLYPAVERHAFRERMRGLLMAALQHSGRGAEALLVYEDGRRLLAQELGVDPSPPLRQRYQELLTGRWAVPPTAAGGLARA